MHFIYFVRAEGTGFVKIGRAKDPFDRMADLQVANPHRLVLAGVLFTQDEDKESELHFEFRNLRVRGEWFREEGGLALLILSLPPPPRDWRELWALRTEGLFGVWEKDGSTQDFLRKDQSERGVTNGDKLQ